MDSSEQTPRNSHNWRITASIILVSIVTWVILPYFTRARATSGLPNCINNLRQIENAQEQWALENKKTNGTPIHSKEAAEIEHYIKGGFPKCRQGGSYSYKPVGQAPTCTISGHSL